MDNLQAPNPIKHFIPNVKHYPVKITADNKKISAVLEYVVGTVIVGGVYIPHIRKVKYSATIDMTTSVNTNMTTSSTQNDEQEYIYQ